jgi:hypothetical protein
VAQKDISMPFNKWQRRYRTGPQLGGEDRKDSEYSLYDGLDKVIGFIENGGTRESQRRMVEKWSDPEDR